MQVWKTMLALYAVEIDPCLQPGHAKARAAQRDSEPSHCDQASNLHVDLGPVTRTCCSQEVPDPAINGVMLQIALCCCLCPVQ